MILDQMKSMGSFSSGEDTSWMDEINKGFADVSKNLGIIGSSLQQTNNFLAKEGGLLSSFFSSMERLGDTQVGLLEGIDRSVNAQTTIMSVIGKTKLTIMKGIHSEILALRSDLGATITAFETSQEDLFENLSRLTKNQEAAFRDVLKSFKNSYNHSGGGTRGPSIPIKGEDDDTATDVAARRASDKSSSTFAKFTKKFGGLMLMMSGFMNTMTSFAADLDENFASVEDKIALTMGQNKINQVFDTYRQARDLARERAEYDTRLPQGWLASLLDIEAHVYTAQDYAEAMNAALDAGVAATDHFATVTSEIAFMNKVMPGLAADVDGYIKDIVKAYEDGGDRVRGVALMVKEYSDNMWTTPEQLQKVVSNYHRAIDAITSDMDDYIDKMESVIRAQARLDQASLDNLGMMETLDKLAYTAVSEWDQEMLQGLAMIGLNPMEIEQLALHDQEAALEKMVDAAEARFGQFRNEDGSIDTTSASWHMMKEWSNLMGWDTKDLMNALKGGGGFDQFQASKGVDYASFNEAGNTSQAMMQESSDILNEQVNMSWTDELTAVKDNTDWIYGIHEMLKEAGLGASEGRVLAGGFSFFGEGGLVDLADTVVDIVSLFKGKNLGKNIKGLFKGNVFKNIGNTFKSGFKGLGNWAKGLFKGNTFKNISNTFKTGFKGLGNWAKGLFKGNTFKNIGTSVKNGAKGVGNWFKGLFKSGVGDDIAKGVANYGDDVVKGVATYGDDVLKGASALSKGSGFLSKAAGVVGKVAPWLSVAGAAIEGFTGASDTEKIASTLGKSSEDVTFGDRAAAFVGTSLGGTGPGWFEEGSFKEKAGNTFSNVLKGAGIGAFGGPIGAAIGAGVGLVTSVIGADNITKFGSGVGESFKDKPKEEQTFIDKAKDWTKGLPVLGTISGLAQGIQDWDSSDIAGSIGKVVGGTLNGIPVVSGLANGIANWDKEKGVGENLLNVADKTVESIPLIGQGYKFIKGLFGGKDDKSKDETKEATDDLKKDIVDTGLTATPLSNTQSSFTGFEGTSVYDNVPDVGAYGNPFAYTDYEALSNDALYNPSKNLANYDGIYDTSQITANPYTNEQALYDGALSLNNPFASSVISGTYGDLSNSLVNTGPSTLGLTSQGVLQDMVPTYLPYQETPAQPGWTDIRDEAVPLSSMPTSYSQEDSISPEVSDSVSIVDAIMSLEQNVISRLDTIIGGNTYKPPAQALSNSSPVGLSVPQVRALEQDITSQSITNYV